MEPTTRGHSRTVPSTTTHALRPRYILDTTNHASNTEHQRAATIFGTRSQNPSSSEKQSRRHRCPSIWPDRDTQLLSQTTDLSSTYSQIYQTETTILSRAKPPFLLVDTLADKSAVFDNRSRYYDFMYHSSKYFAMLIRMLIDFASTIASQVVTIIRHSLSFYHTIHQRQRFMPRYNVAKEPLIADHQF
jgi:hypothetical protein